MALIRESASSEKIYCLFPIVQAVHCQRTVHDVTSFHMQSYSETVKTETAVLCLLQGVVRRYSRFQTAEKNSALLRSSVWQFGNSNDVFPRSITKQSTPSYVLTICSTSVNQVEMSAYTSPYLLYGIIRFSQLGERGAFCPPSPRKQC